MNKTRACPGASLPTRACLHVHRLHVLLGGGCQHSSTVTRNTLTLLEHGVDVLMLSQQGLLQVVQDAKLVKVLLGHVGVCTGTRRAKRSAQAYQHNCPLQSVSCQQSCGHAS
jgi:hypothetical protein